MTGDEWPDIRQYADIHETFPHETTADQFFDEDQFEAYRHLGYKDINGIYDRREFELETEPENASVDNTVATLKKIT